MEGELEEILAEMLERDPALAAQENEVREALAARLAATALGGAAKPGATKPMPPEVRKMFEAERRRRLRAALRKF